MCVLDFSKVHTVGFGGVGLGREARGLGRLGFELPIGDSFVDRLFRPFPDTHHAGAG